MQRDVRGTDPLRNWAGNHDYSTDVVVRPRTLDEVRAAVVSAEKARAVGARHSFSDVGDTTGTLISTEYLTRVDEPDDRGRVAVGPGLTYGALATALSERGRALPNFASLPHISIGGAVATATHGSGRRNGSLASAVCAFELVCADGTVCGLRRGDADFDGSVVSLGALGVVTSLTLETVPEFELRQYVFEGVPWELAESELPALLSYGYSTSLFLSWAGPTVEQALVKTPEAVDSFFGMRAATAPLHPIPGADPAHTTDQLGIPGRSSERLPHFRLGGIPSAGDELQSEYAVAAESAGDCLRALRSVGPEIAPVLHVSEIRAVASDSYWISPFFGRESVTFHFTWKRDPSVVGAIATVEAALAEWEPRPHWAKLFGITPATLHLRYATLDRFLELRRQYDPGGKFGNDFVDRLQAGGSGGGPSK
jgi:xylitol oxidase